MSLGPVEAEKGGALSPSPQRCFWKRNLPAPVSGRTQVPSLRDGTRESAHAPLRLPYKIEIDERCPQDMRNWLSASRFVCLAQVFCLRNAFCSRFQGKNIDCIGLSLGQCPQEEWLGEGVGTQERSHRVIMCRVFASGPSCDRSCHQKGG